MYLGQVVCKRRPLTELRQHRRRGTARGRRLRRKYKREREVLLRVFDGGSSVSLIPRSTQISRNRHRHRTDAGWGMAFRSPSSRCIGLCWQLSTPADMNAGNFPICSSCVRSTGITCLCVEQAGRAPGFNRLSRHTYPERCCPMLDVEYGINIFLPPSRNYIVGYRQ